MQRINKKNSKQLTGYSLEKLVALTGIYGIHAIANLEAATVSFEAHISARNVTVDIETYLVEELVVEINLQAKIISNLSIKTTGVQKGISFSMLEAQVAAARKAGFHSLELNAYGYPSIKGKYNGYITWGKYGYLMADKADQATFMNKMKEHGRPEKRLYDLLATKDGLQLWENTIGFKWLGVFNCRKNSESMQILSEVRNRKNQSPI